MDWRSIFAGQMGIQSRMADHAGNPLPLSSSTPPEFPPVQRALFVEAINLLRAHGVPFVVSGAFALHQHTGIWRDTKDLDLFLVHEDVPRALAVLEAEGFETEICDPVWLCKARRGDYFVDLITGMSNGVIRVEREWIVRATEAEVLGVAACVLAPEELIASKLFVTRRERFDGADILHVLQATARRLDWRRMEQLAGEHWLMLLWVLVLYEYVYPAESSSIPRVVWNSLLWRLRDQLDHPDKEAHFRGSLIDDKMFAIDVQEWGMEDLNGEMREKLRRAG